VCAQDYYIWTEDDLSDNTSRVMASDIDTKALTSHNVFAELGLITNILAYDAVLQQSMKGGFSISVNTNADDKSS
jgi:hypothetical protein